MSRFHNWDEKRLRELKEKGLIRDYVVSDLKVHKLDEPKGKKVVSHRKRKSKEKDWIAWNLLVWAQEHGFDLYQEYRFSERKFRFDHALIKGDLKIAVEYEGLFSEKSGHTTVAGYTKDTQKYNLGQSLGWKIIRVTALNYETLISELNKLV